MTLPPNDIPGLLAILKEGSVRLNAMAKSMEYPWDPTPPDPRVLHNMYARNLICCYASKFADLSTSILHSVEQSNFLTYALCGRALIETTATLRYYMLHQYKPLIEQDALNTEDGFRRLIEIDERHLRGTRFDWESFISQRYSKLKEDVIAYLKDKKQKTPTSESRKLDQVSVLTCVEKWAGEVPEAMIAYNLFCDLVHPNVGSTFLVASRADDKFYFSRFRGEPMGRDIFDRSFPMLMSLTHRPFAEHIGMLMTTIWPDEELSSLT